MENDFQYIPIEDTSNLCLIVLFENKDSRSALIARTEALRLIHDVLEADVPRIIK